MHKNLEAGRTYSYYKEPPNAMPFEEGENADGDPAGFIYSLRKWKENDWMNPPAGPKEVLSTRGVVFDGDAKDEFQEEISSDLGYDIGELDKDEVGGTAFPTM